jgi:hypothetical protein
MLIEIPSDIKYIFKKVVPLDNSLVQHERIHSQEPTMKRSFPITSKSQRNMIKMISSVDKIPIISLVARFVDVGIKYESLIQSGRQQSLLRINRPVLMSSTN